MSTFSTAAVKDKTSIWIFVGQTRVNFEIRIEAYLGLLCSLSCKCSCSKKRSAAKLGNASWLMPVSARRFFCCCSSRVSQGGSVRVSSQYGSAGTSAVVTSVCLWVFQCQAKEVMKTLVIMKDEQPTYRVSKRILQFKKIIRKCSNTLQISPYALLIHSSFLWVTRFQTSQLSQAHHYFWGCILNELQLQFKDSKTKIHFFSHADWPWPPPSTF